MKEGAFIPPVHWDNNIFLQMVEPALTTELERHLWARLSQAVRYEAVFDENDYETYTTEDLESTVKERDGTIAELETENEGLKNKIEELEEKVSDLESDNDYLDRKLTAALNKLSED